MSTLAHDADLAHTRRRCQLLGCLLDMGLGLASTHQQLDVCAVEGRQDAAQPTGGASPSAPSTAAP